MMWFATGVLCGAAITGVLGIWCRWHYVNELNRWVRAWEAVRDDFHYNVSEWSPENVAAALGILELNRPK